MTSPALHELRILIVDSKATNTMLLRGILGGIGIHHVMAVENSDEALSVLQANAFDAIFCDEAVQPLNPIAFSIMLRRDPAMKGQKAPILLVSRGAQKRQVELARDAGINDFVLVPLSMNTVKQKLLSVLQNPKAFIMEESFSGPDRRHREERRRQHDDAAKPAHERRRSRWQRRRTDPQSPDREAG